MSSLQAAERGEPVLLQEARRSLAESLPQVAAQKLTRLLADPDLPPDDRETATLVLARALLAAGRIAEALELVDPSTTGGRAEAELLRAEILVSARRWAEALPLFQSLAEHPEAAASARFGEAETLHALGRTDEAVKVLEAFVKTEPASNFARLRLVGLLVETSAIKKARKILSAMTPATPEEVRWREYLEGRILLMEDHAAPALAQFEALLREPE
ncbi:MAG: tetratricopeptide repeat protein, partial [Verrucomicrobiota bacterium]|nr:tetratricopeptide repeat protein [Verrucomicrobiota bacterium]